MGVVSPNGVGNAASPEGVLNGTQRQYGAFRASIQQKSRCRLRARFRISTNSRGSKSAIGSMCRGRCCSSAGSGYRGFVRRWTGYGLPSFRAKTAPWRDHWFRWRITGVHRGAVSAVLSSAIEADEFVLRADRGDGFAFERLNVRFGLRGASHVITTGCTSSTDAFGYSLRENQSGRLDMV